MDLIRNIYILTDFFSNPRITLQRELRSEKYLFVHLMSRQSLQLPYPITRRFGFEVKRAHKHTPSTVEYTNFKTKQPTFESNRNNLENLRK